MKNIRGLHIMNSSSQRTGYELRKVILMDFQSDYHILLRSIVDESQHLAYCESDMNFMKHHDLANHYLMRCESQLPFLNERISHLLKYQKNVREIQELANAFIKEDIKVVFMKGLSLAESYPHQTSRILGDCELLVSRTDLTRVQMQLIGLKYSRNCDDYAESMTESSMNESIIIDGSKKNGNMVDGDHLSITYFSKPDGLNITLFSVCNRPSVIHTESQYIKEISPIDGQLFEQIYANPILLNVEGVALMVPVPALHYMYIINDMRRIHLNYVIGIKHLLDLVYFSNAHGIRHKEVHQVYQAFGYGDFHCLIVSACHHILHMPLAATDWLLDQNAVQLKQFWEQVCQMKNH